MNILENFKKVIASEAEAILNIPMTQELEDAVKMISSCNGKVLTTGIGKAGYVARKAASTFSTTGTPACFLHPGDASHGDVGIIGDKDILIAFSNSGKTREVIETVRFARQLHLSALITITGQSDSPLAENSDITLLIGEITEPCPFGLTPTASTAAMCALADALAMCTMIYKGISRSDFAIRHHGGYLGEKLALLAPSKG